ncbi:MAG TPA: DUF3567 family protein [Burkholderiales bacterium]|jgi:hypothetical protein|nr:DUF3567 family protein [Burkholderiales bacterium]
MRVLYDSSNYYVVEFPGRHGIELVDKRAGRTAYLQGMLEARFRASMADLCSQENNDESVDEFLGYYDALLTNPLVMH